MHVSLGTDVGGGTGFSMLKEGLQAYFMQQLQGEQGVSLTPRTCCTSPPTPAHRR
ncbi:hypothetical protein [Deinococcus cavernae]|uniref:hypothetical protein n=1 Tax=Deinococcus cavernae TaxID=2320857 RepID=UPI001F195FD6|nr:hypothetical protein [Deinococcus cavernae]